MHGQEIPDISDPSRGLRHVVPPWFRAAVEESRGVLVFFDEIGSVTETLQGAALRVLSERSIEGFDLGPHVRFSAAANPPGIAAGASELAPAFSFRFLHLIAKVNPLEVVRYLRGEPTAAQAFPILDLDAFRGALPAARSTVAAYLEAHPEATEESPDDLDGRWPLVAANPRAWEHSAAILAACDVTGRRDLLPVLTCGTVGPAAGVAWLAYERTADLPRPAALAADPSAWTPDPQRPDRDLAILDAVRTWSTEQINGTGVDAGRWLGGWRIVARALDCGRRDIVAPLARALSSRDSRPTSLPRTPEAATVARLIADLAPVLRHAGPAGGV
jgi:hypothetical protein